MTSILKYKDKKAPRSQIIAHPCTWHICLQEPSVDLLDQRNPEKYLNSDVVLLEQAITHNSKLAILLSPLLKGSRPIIFLGKLGICPQPACPPPLPERWDTNNSKKIFDVYFAF